MLNRKSGSGACNRRNRPLTDLKNKLPWMMSSGQTGVSVVRVDQTREPAQRLRSNQEKIKNIM